MATVHVHIHGRTRDARPEHPLAQAVVFAVQNETGERSDAVRKAYANADVYADQYGYPAGQFKAAMRRQWPSILGEAR